MRMSDRIYLMNQGKIEQSGSPMELYLSPQSSYAASFIGHYNMIEGSQWKALGGSQDGEGHYAVRPESISLSAAPWNVPEDAVTFQGVVRQIIYQGNVVRYTIQVGSLELDVDQLYEGKQQYKRGDTVYLMLEKDTVIHYPPKH